MEITAIKQIKKEDFDKFNKFGELCLLLHHFFLHNYSIVLEKKVFIVTQREITKHARKMPIN